MEVERAQETQQQQQQQRRQEQQQSVADEKARKKRPKVRKRKRGPQMDCEEAETERRINKYKERLFSGGNSSSGWFDAANARQ